ncbi:MAG: VOC family protein [Chloroflexota bacterium]
MKKIQTQGVHHITLIGADRQTSIDFWEGVLGMPFIFEQPNLDVPAENHLYFDPGDGRLITVFTNEDRQPDPTRNPEGIGNLHHLAFTVSRAMYTQIGKRLDARGISHTGAIDRGFMDSIYFRDPLGQLIECACYKFEPPVGSTHAEVLLEAHKLRVARNEYNITDEQLADAIQFIIERTQGTLSDERTPKDPYTEKPPVWD